MVEQDCAQLHTPCPTGYVEWHLWAEEKSRTHKQERCPNCDLWAIWKPKKRKHVRCRHEVEE